MRKFKLIKNYPDSGLELGDVLDFTKVDRIRRASSVVYGFDYVYDLRDVQKFTEFWQEIKEAILVTEDGVEAFIGDTVYWVDLKLDDGCEYTTEFQYMYDLPLVYRHAKLIENSKNGCNYKVFSTEKAAREYVENSKRKPLFTTEDGVEIFEGGRFFYVNMGWEILSAPAQEGMGSEYLKHFSTKQAAEKYVRNNKPVLSLKEILDCVPLEDHQAYSLRKLAKSKFNQ